MTCRFSFVFDDWDEDGGRLLGTDQGKVGIRLPIRIFNPSMDPAL